MIHLRKKIWLAGVLWALGAAAQNVTVNPGPTGTSFPRRLAEWLPGEKWCDDENFFISRVRPAQRFRNAATQIDPALGEDADKNLIFWVPLGDETHSGHPAGRFDSETFTQWSYVTHYGVWNAPLAAVPAGFMDAAHRNGVGVSAVAPVPFGNLTPEWEEALRAMTGAGAEKMAAWLNRCGLDGIGYNSEFTCDPQVVAELAAWHGELRRHMESPLKEIIWYDGTSEGGYTMFDFGLGNHNDDIMGNSDEPRSCLFFNYNWNYPSTLERSVAKAREIGRSPLDLYCGINMQGREPHDLSRGLWSLLKEYPLSIGLWGAHGANMFWESRAEKGNASSSRIRNYLSGLERWFAGGTRNPMTARYGAADNIAYGDGNTDFPGMSSMMTARSSLSWDLAQRPFITSFCLGNGRFFNLAGERCHDSEWYDMGAQDYLPTWTWWWAGEWLGRHPEGVPAEGLRAEYAHDDAWTGGSSVRISGSAPEEWLHLFKTKFDMVQDDCIILRLKHLSGRGKVSLVVAAEGNEGNPEVIPLDITPGRADWQEFRITADNYEGGCNLGGRSLAIAGLLFEEAEDLDLRLGSFEVSRPGAVCSAPAAPEIERAEVAAAGPEGAVGKLVFQMPDEAAKGQYNIDHGVSHFNLYARAQGGRPQLRGTTTPWAALMWNIPGDWSAEEARLELGVSAVGLDGKSESAISWSEPLPTAPVYAEEPREEIPEYVLPREFGAAPEIVSLSASESDGGDMITLTAEVDVPRAVRSRAVRTGASGFGFAYADSPLPQDVMAPHSVSFRFRADAPADGSERCLAVLRDRTEEWAVNHTGTFRHLLAPDGSTSRIVLAGSALGDVEYYYDTETRLLPGHWHHLTYTFDSDGEGGMRLMWFLDGKLQVPVKRVRGRHTYTDGEIPYETRIKEWRPGNVFEVGGYMHGAVPADGAVACMRVHPYPLVTEESVLGSMADPGQDMMMLPVAYRDSGTEGKGELYHPAPEYTSGPPVDFGEDYPLPLEISWQVFGGSLAASGEEDTASGVRVTAQVVPDGSGNCRAVLNARNDLGADSEEADIARSGVQGVEETGLQAWPNPFEDRIRVRLPHEGKWTAVLSDSAGRRVMACTFRADTESVVTLYPEVSPGLYFLTLADERENVRTARLIRR